MKEFLQRLAFKLSGHKALFTIILLALLVLHDFSPENADVIKSLVYAVFGAKAVQYVKDAVQSARSKES